LHIFQNKSNCKTKNNTEQQIKGGACVTEQLVDLVAERMVKERKVRMDRAKELINELSSDKSK
jgi:hypothetical protein